MASVDIFQASRMKQIEDTTVVSGLVDANGNLLLATRVGEVINAGNVVGPQGSGFTYRGAWAEATTYAVDDVVTSDGSTFVVTAVHISSTTAPTADAPGANLALWAGKGERGVDGVIGSDGADGIDGSTALPAGTISLWASDVAPSNWLICDGSAVSRTEYPSLFDAIGIKYGAGDGVNTFNLPNLKGRTPIGKDSTQTEFDALAKIGGEKAHLLTAAESGLPAHNHLQDPHFHHVGASQAANGTADVLLNQEATGGVHAGWSIALQAASPGLRRVVATTNTPTNKPNTAANASQAHNILQPYTVVNFIIKVTNGDTPGDSQLTDRVSELEANFSATPAGTMALWPSDIAPTNWLLCDGTAVSRTTYASLFAAVGTKYGIGDGSTTFNLPNLKGRVPVGRDSAQTEFDTLGETGGTKTHQHQHISPLGKASGNMYLLDVNDAKLDKLGSSYDFYSIENPIGMGGGWGVTQSIMETHSVTSSPSGTLQPYQVVNYIIKFTNGDTKGDSQLTGRISDLESGSAYSVKVRDKVRLLQHALTGGGVRKVTFDKLSWGPQFRAMGAGRDDLTPPGYFNIAMPPNGTVIPVHGNASTASVTVAAGFIPTTGLSGYAALYYDLPMGSNSFVSDPSRFHFLDYETGPQEIPPSWILVCARNVSDPLTVGYRWGDGRLQDYWRPLTLQNGWIQYGSPFPVPSWRWRGDGSIVLRGLVKNGAVGLISHLADLGPEGPVAASAAAIYTVASGSGNARVDVYPNGFITLQSYQAGGTNTHVGLDNISWYPSDV